MCYLILEYLSSNSNNINMFEITLQSLLHHDTTNPSLIPGIILHVEMLTKKYEHSMLLKQLLKAILK